MLESFVVNFNYSDFLKKLRHYFSDTAPVYAKVWLDNNEITVSNGEKEIHVQLNSHTSVTGLVNSIIQECEKVLYPKMRDEKYCSISFDEDRRKEMILQGYSLSAIHRREVHDVSDVYIITRFNANKNTIDYKSDTKYYRAFFKRPLVTSRNYILELSKKGKEGMNDLYKFIIENSKIEELANA